MPSKTGIMQPYFLPYIGYFQLISAVDLFIIYDDIKYTKKGWINRNRLLLNSRDYIFTLPLKNASDALDICDRRLSDEFNPKRLLNQFRGAYGSAPYFSSTYNLLEQIMYHEESNLFLFIEHSIRKVCKHLEIKTPIAISSEFAIDHTLKGQDKVISLCKKANSGVYINPIGGTNLYSKDTFMAEEIELRFIRPQAFKYRQFNHEFVPWLSIVDIMMFNPIETIRDMLNNSYTLE